MRDGSWGGPFLFGACDLLPVSAGGTGRSAKWVLEILLKIVGIGLVSEIAEMICKDSGNASLARGMELLGSAVILSLSLPILETFLDLIQRILGEI